MRLSGLLHSPALSLIPGVSLISLLACTPGPARSSLIDCPPVNLSGAGAEAFKREVTRFGLARKARTPPAAWSSPGLAPDWWERDGGWRRAGVAWRWRTPGVPAASQDPVSSSSLPVGPLFHFSFSVNVISIALFMEDGHKDA